MDSPENKQWERTRKELRSDMEKGFAVIKKGIIAFQKKAEDLADESKRQYQIAATKSKIRDARRDLGGRVYALISKAETENPALDEEVKAIVARIKGLEEEIAKLKVKVASPQPVGQAPGAAGGEPEKAQEKTDEGPTQNTGEEKQTS
jgi:predicted  nucleic acid-binding Zn-ribbon protein